MKYCVTFLILLVTTGCLVYDPPLKGNDIFIHNQTADFVYVLDSLPATGTLPLYDTFSINSKPIIEAKPNYISKYGTWDYFFEEEQYRLLKQNGVDSLTFYFIPPQSPDSSYININRQYTILKLSIDDAWNKPVSHIFYYGDSIAVTHKYNIGKWTGKQVSN
jgi:hypothetical protein